MLVAQFLSTLNVKKKKKENVCKWGDRHVTLICCTDKKAASPCFKPAMECGKKITLKLLRFPNGYRCTVETGHTVSGTAGGPEGGTDSSMKISTWTYVTTNSKSFFASLLFKSVICRQPVLVVML